MIRPFPRVKQDARFKDGSVLLSGADQLERFLYCLEGWAKAAVGIDGKPVVDEISGLPVIDADGIAVADPEGKDIKLKLDVKKAIFDANWEGIADFVLEKSGQFDIQKEEAEKN